MEKEVVQSSNTKMPKVQEVSQSAIQAHETPKQKSWVIIGLAILVFLLLGTNGFFAYQNLQLKKEQLAMQTKFNPIQTPIIPSPAVIPIVKELCNTGGALKMFGYDWIGDDIVLTCDCLAESEHKSEEGAMDADWVECKGEIDYMCYKLNTSRENLHIGPFDKNFMSYVKTNSKVIPCPPNHWMNTRCGNDNECDLLNCGEGFSPKCEEWGCACQ